MFDLTTNVWRWTLNHLPIPPYPPWGPGQPITPISAVHRMQIYHTNRYDAHWRTVPDTQSHRYICEVTNTFYYLWF